MRKSTPSESDMELTSEELDELVLDLPLAQRKLITSSADFSVATIVTMLRDDALIIPRFQRQYIWSEKKASRLVESLILQCPIPVIYLNRRSDEILEVVDGNQRVNSLRRFIDGAFSLTGLTAYPELEDFSYSKLDQKFQRQIKNRTIRCVIIEPESHAQIKFDVFERLNSGSTPLSPQELRHGLQSGPYVKFLEDLADDSRLIALTGIKIDKRMRRDELALRFFAFCERMPFYEKPLSNFLTDYLKDNRYPSPGDIGVRNVMFHKMLADLQEMLGVDSFRLKGGDGDAKKFNTAYFDAISVGYATSRLISSQIDRAAISQDLKEKLNVLSADGEFRRNTLRATSDKAAIERRIEMAREVFDSCV